jgi:nucleoside 2-deoxyribosyltransferase
MKITICASMKFHLEMETVKKTLEAAGHTVLIPKKGEEGEIPIEAREGITKDEIIAAKIEYDFIREHMRNIEKCDAVLILNYEKNGIQNYIGGNTFLEMGVAFWLGKIIYLLHPIPDMDYATEMHALQPIILHGNLKNITYCTAR